MINGRIFQPPPNYPLYDYWVRCNDMVFTWLSNALSEDIADSILHCDTDRDLWRDIEKRYGQSSASRYYQIQRKIGGYLRVHLILLITILNLGNCGMS